MKLKFFIQIAIKLKAKDLLINWNSILLFA